jgi:hypothetical protein
MGIMAFGKTHGILPMRMANYQHPMATLTFLCNTKFPSKPAALPLRHKPWPAVAKARSSPKITDNIDDRCAAFSSRQARCASGDRISACKSLILLPITAFSPPPRFLPAHGIQGKRVFSLDPCATLRLGYDGDCLSYTIRALWSGKSSNNRISRPTSQFPSRI